MKENFGFVKVAAAIPSVRVADCQYNVSQMLPLVQQAEDTHVAVLCFPELSITASTCQDLFQQQVLVCGAEKAMVQLMEQTSDLNVIILVGVPVRHVRGLLNCAAVIQRGKLLGLVGKQYVSLDEQRRFVSSDNIPETEIVFAGQEVKLSSAQIFTAPEFTFAVEVGNDAHMPVSPATLLVMNGADIVFNLCSEKALAGRENYLKQFVCQQSARCHAAYVMCGCGYGESTQDFVFPGYAYICEDGRMLAHHKAFSISPQLVAIEVDVEKLRATRMKDAAFGLHAKRIPLHNLTSTPVVYTTTFDSEKDSLLRTIDATPFIPQGNLLNNRCEEIFQIQTLGLIRRMEHTHARSLVLGISGGLDSTLALLVCAQACDVLSLPRTSIIGVTMPGFGTTDRTYTNALDLMRLIGVTTREISIKDACIQHFDDINHDVNLHDVTYENSQARERTQILMDIANQVNGLVVGTGDLSELALGWATYNGDHMSMYGVNASVPKTFIRHLVTWIARNRVEEAVCCVLLDIVDTPISPELIPADENGNIKQKTEDLVGPYELHDFFLYYFLRFGFSPAKIRYMANNAFAGVYTDSVITYWLRTFCRRFFQQQFKRSCLPDGPMVGSCSLSPRGSWSMPTDALCTLWLADLN